MLHVLLPQINFGDTFSKLADADLAVQRTDAAFLFEKLALACKHQGHSTHGRYPGKVLKIRDIRAWVGYEYGLCVYAMQASMEWQRRGHHDDLTPRLAALAQGISHEYKLPPWIGNLDIHRAHRAHLLRQNEKYARVWPGTDVSLPMLYPVLSPHHIDGYYLEDDKSGVQ